MIKIGMIQTNPQEDLKKNLSNVKKFIEKAAKQNVDLVILPETFTFMGMPQERILCAKKHFKKCFDFLKGEAQKHHLHIVGGSMDEFREPSSYARSAYISDEQRSCNFISDESKLFNTNFTFSPSGQVMSEYRKLHLFNLFDDHGKPSYCESEVYKPGSVPKTYPIDIHQTHWKALNIICYDIRFPEIMRHMGEPFDILFVPAAFTWQTGQDHWEVLLRARAIENQCYVVACNQTGYFLNQAKRNYGNSMIIDPWGRVIARLGEEEDILVCEISKAEIKKSRSRLPALQDRKIFSAVSMSYGDRVKDLDKRK